MRTPVQFLEPIHAKGREVDELTELVEEAMLAEFEKISWRPVTSAARSRAAG